MCEALRNTPGSGSTCQIILTKAPCGGAISLEQSISLGLGRLIRKLAGLRQPASFAKYILKKTGSSQRLLLSLTVALGKEAATLGLYSSSYWALRASKTTTEAGPRGGIS